jgi:hypothetical protein
VDYFGELEDLTFGPSIVVDVESKPDYLDDEDLILDSEVEWPRPAYNWDWRLVKSFQLLECHSYYIRLRL